MSPKTARPSIAFVTNFCAHYRVRTFERLAREFDAEFLFFSPGADDYWLAGHGVHGGAFRHVYLRGFRLGRAWVTPALPLRLLASRARVFIKCINDRFALPATYVAARLKRVPFILWTGVWMRVDSPAQRLLFPVTRWLYRHADAIVTYGDHVKRYLESEGVAAERIFVAPHAVDNETCGRVVTAAERDRVRDRVGVPAGAPMLLNVGRLEGIKGLGYLLEAFARLDRADAVLVFAGEGGERRALAERARDLGVSGRVRFPGYVPSPETAAWYAAASVFVLPSVTTRVFREPWGLVVNEAFNQGLPVIATTAVGAAAGGLVRDGENGLVVPERDASALAGALARLLGDPDLHRRLSAGARRTIAAWDNEAMVGGFRRAIEYVSRVRS